MSLKIHVYTICWNESRMLPHFLDYYSSFCEKIVVYDNFSTDNSRAICEQFPKVLIKSFYTNNQIRDDIYLKIKNEAWKNSRGQCDYVIVCDVDEFIYHPSLPAFLTGMKEKGITLFRPIGFNMIAKEYPGVNSNLLESIPEGARATDFDKICIFDPNLIEEINFESGAHSCLPVGILQFCEGDLKLLHYKFIGLDYTLKRYQEMGKRLSAYNKKKRLGYHYLFSSRRISKEFKHIWESRERVI